VTGQVDPPGEVQLFVSGDLGRRWSLYQTRPTTAHKFDFQAGQDGEYWFVVGSDRNRAKPQPGTKPDKIAVVDTQRPRVELRVEQIAAGKITASWSADDAHLDAQTFRLSYRLDADEDWKAVEVVLPRSSETLFSGEASWMVSHPQQPVAVRAEICDRAGNASEISRTVSPDSASQRHDLASESTRPLAQFTSDRPGTVHRVPHEARPSDQRRWTSEDGASPASEPRLASDNFDTGWKGAYRSDRDVNSPPPFNARESDQSTDSDMPNPIGSDGAADPAALDAADHGAESATAEPPRHYANSLAFNLEYDVISEDQSKLARVELWMTRDNGQSWAAYGTDEDLRSPFAVQVTEEGTYGFQLLLHDQEGRANESPRAGDRPDMIVEVDITRPQAYVKSALHGRGQRPGFVEIEWFADDKNLGDDGVILSYSETIHGPWIIIGRGLPNTGHYEWQSPTKLPRSFYVQIDVQDRSGNRTVHRLDDPTILSAEPPRAKLRSVRPANGVDRT
jgi:hypothetical protein